MSEDRTQAPTKRRRQIAREQGQVAFSAELSAAAGFLAAAMMLSIQCNSLANALLGMMRYASLEELPLSANLAEVAAHLRQLAFAVAWPVGLVLVSFVAAAVGVHELQVGGLLTLSRLAPDPSRLWRFGVGPSLDLRCKRALWGLVKAVLLVAVAGWVLYADLLEFQRLGFTGVSELSQSIAAAVWRMTLIIAIVMLLLGVVDYVLQYQRFESLLRSTSEEQREDMRSTEGDPALRARRRGIAKAWWSDSSDIIRRATLVLTGPSGLTVVLAGGPPPRPVEVCLIVTGKEGEKIRRETSAARVEQLAAPILSRAFAQRKPPNLPPTGLLLTELKAIWPSELNQPAGRASQPMESQPA